MNAKARILFVVLALVAVACGQEAPVESLAFEDEVATTTTVAPTSTTSTAAFDNGLDDDTFVFGGKAQSEADDTGYRRYLDEMTPVVLNLYDCPVAYGIVGFAQGSTAIASVGHDGDMCVFQFGSETETPEKYGVVNTQCSLPADAEVTFDARFYGDSVDFSTIADFCEPMPDRNVRS